MMHKIEYNDEDLELQIDDPYVHEIYNNLSKKLKMTVGGRKRKHRKTVRKHKKSYGKPKKRHYAKSKKRIPRSEALESKIGWSSPGYRKAIAAPAPIKKRKVRMSSTKKKSLGS